MAQGSALASGRLGLNSPVTVLAGVGQVKATAYARAGVRTLEDLLYHIPRAYENRGDIRTLADSRTDGGKTALVLTIATEPQAARLRGHMTIVKFRAYDESGTAEITYFNQPYLKTTFVLGSEWRFYGVVERKPMRGGTRYILTTPAFEQWREGTLPDFTAVYPLSEGLTQKQVAANVGEALRYCVAGVDDPLPDEIRRGRGLCTLAFALRNIHSPENYASLAAAKRRLVFDELFCFALGMTQRGRRVRESGAYPCTKQNISLLLERLPYTLTDAQKKAISEIAADMRSDTPMSRIVIGDVGCGKTVVAAAAIYIAVLSGRQAALMAPTEILARQHFADLGPLFASLGVGCELLVGATTAAEKKRIRASLVNPDPEKRLPVVIGTHALISQGVEFAALSLVVNDEQHRFGVSQRAALAAKTEHPHVLAMSATPIPRSLALVVYGDLDISKIDQMPAGRQKVETYVVDESYRERVDGFIRRTVEQGGQVYIVCPSIEEAQAGDRAAVGGEVSIDDISLDGFEEKPPLKAAVAYAEELKAKMPDISIEFIHGKLKAAQKDAIMTDFTAGRVQVLVSTTVIEVGVNVANASLMIVENAERFGLSQLHQLRGRVGRGTRKSYCILVSDDAGISAKRRLDVMKSTNDGFAVAQADLEARGPGDFFAKNATDGMRQSGGVRFRFADLCGDSSLLAAATESARELSAADPDLEQHPLLKNLIASMFSSETAAD